MSALTCPTPSRMVRRPPQSARPAPSAPAASRPRRGELQLTRRGRVVVTLVFLGVVLSVLTLFSGYSAASGVPGEPMPTRTVIVAEGDTLWAIAASVAAPGEVRDVMHRIEELNSLERSGLVEGQRLAVPVP